MLHFYLADNNKIQMIDFGNVTEIDSDNIENDINTMASFMWY